MYLRYDAIPPLHVSLQARSSIMDGSFSICSSLTLVLIVKSDPVKKRWIDVDEVDLPGPALLDE